MARLFISESVPIVRAKVVPLIFVEALPSAQNKAAGLTGGRLHTLTDYNADAVD